MVAALDTRQQDLPVGTILMYDGIGWKDGNDANPTLPGWYACNAANAAAGRTPDLTDSFIMGRAGVIADNQKIGGTNSVVLQENNIPLLDAVWESVGCREDADRESMAYGHAHSAAHHWLLDGIATIDAGAGSHEMYSVGLNFGKSNPDALDNRPKYYSVIYIKRCE